VNNPHLADDYKKRARGRRAVVELLISKQLYADAVREAQEAAELALKSLIRRAGHAVPFTHEVSACLKAIRDDLPQAVQGKLERLCEISKDLRRDRELSFYGSEDITPSEFYEEKDAVGALQKLDEILAAL
jgi:HEPN domain-containing protein